MKDKTLFKHLFIASITLTEHNMLNDENDNNLPVLLDMPEYESWLDIVTGINTNKDAAQNMLTSTSAEEKAKLLNGRFAAFEPDWIYKMQAPSNRISCKFAITRPWIVTAAFNHLESMKSLLDHGIDVLQTEQSGYNVIHVLIFLAYVDNNTIPMRLQMVHELKNMLTIEQLKALLFHEEGITGLRPLELASHLGVFAFVPQILESKGVYLVKEECHGIYKRQWFDITDYEAYDNFSRCDKSPLFLMLFTDKAVLKVQSSVEGMKHPLLSSWIRCKMKTYRPFILIWFVIRLLFVICYLFHDIDTGKQTYGQNRPVFNNSTIAYCDTEWSVHLPKGLSISILVYLIIHSICIIVFDIFEVIYYYLKTGFWMVQSPRGRHSMVMHTLHYRVMQILLGVGTLVVTTSNLTFLYVGFFPLPIEWANIIYIQTVTSCIWSILFFVQFIPSLGLFVVSIQRMMENLLQFAIIFVLVITPYVFAFSKALGRMSTACTTDFQTVFMAYYSTFTVMLNMMSFTELDVDETNKTFAYFIHLVFVFMVPVLLLNFLIAIFSTTYADVFDTKELILKLQRLAMIFSVEKRVAHLYPTMFSWFQKHSFICQNGHIYLTQVIIKMINKPLIMK